MLQANGRRRRSLLCIMGYSWPHELTFREDTLYAESVVHCPHFPLRALFPSSVSGSLPSLPVSLAPSPRSSFLEAAPRAYRKVARSRSRRRPAPERDVGATSALRRRYVTLIRVTAGGAGGTIWRRPSEGQSDIQRALLFFFSPFFLLLEPAAASLLSRVFFRANV